MIDETMSMAEGILYGNWLDQQFCTATGCGPGFDDEHEEAARRWRVAEVAGGRDFWADWRAARKAGWR